MQLLNITYFKEKNFTKIIFCTVVLGIFFRIFVNAYGGQLFWFDEMRFNNGYIILTTIADGQYSDAVKRFITNYDHTLFQLISIVLTALRYYYCKLLINSDIEPHFLMVNDSGLSFCSTFSSIIFYLILVVSSLKLFCKYNLDWDFALIPLILYTVSSTITLFSRHLLPYEASITLYILSLSLLLHRKYYLAGLFCTISLLTYNGFSATFLSINIFALFFISICKSRKFKSYLLYSFGILSPIAIIQAVGLYFDLNYFDGLLNWASYASAHQQGDFGIGYKLLPKLFWHSESFLSFLIFLPLFINIKSYFYKRFKFSLWSICLLCFSIIFFIILNSDLLKNSVVYFRTIVQLVPFLCFFVGIGVFYFYKKYKLTLDPKLNIFLFFVFSLIIYNNFKKFLTLDYPRDIISSCTICNNAVKLTNFTEELIEPINYNKTYETIFITNCGPIYPGIKYIKKYNFSKILKRWKHPYQYVPYQYMHFNQKERLLINSIDLEIVCGFIEN